MTYLNFAEQFYICEYLSSVYDVHKEFPIQTYRFCYSQENGLVSI